MMEKEHDRQEILDLTKETVPDELQERAAAKGCGVVANPDGGFILRDMATGGAAMPDSPCSLPEIAAWLDGDGEPWRARIIEQERWTAATLEAYHAGDYLRALRLLAMNGGDGGDIERFIRSFCGECDPVPGWCDR